MGLKVVDGSVSDAARTIDIENSAFGPDPMSPALFPGPMPKDNGRRVTSRAEQLSNSPYVRIVNVVDEELEAEGKDAIIAFSLWYIWDKEPLSESTWPPKKGDMGPGVNAEAMDKFIGGMKDRMFESYDGKHVMYLKIIAVDSAHQRRGAGALLLKWGCDEADRLGIDSYLEATTKGRPLYEKYGYVKTGMFSEDFTRFGGPNDSNICLMARPPVAR